MYTVIFFYCYIYIYSETRGGKDFNFSIYCFFSVPRQTNTHAHTRPVLISIPTPRVATSPFGGGGGGCDYYDDDDSDDSDSDDDGLHPGIYIWPLYTAAAATPV